MDKINFSFTLRKRYLFIFLLVASLLLACGNLGSPASVLDSREVTRVVTGRPALEVEVTRVVTGNLTEAVEVVVIEATPCPQVETIIVSVDSIVREVNEVLEGYLAVVTNIVDGDTIDVSIDGITYRVRYIGMDTPERGDHFFDEATEANRVLVEGETVLLVKDVSETDRYGRLLRYVYLQDGTFVNAELVKQGYALIATFPPDVRHQDLFLELQEEARHAGRGLWADSQ